MCSLSSGTPVLCCTVNSDATCFPSLDELESAVTKLWSPSWQVLYSCCEGSPWEVKHMHLSFPPEDAHQDCCCPEIWRPLLYVNNVVICPSWFHTKLLLRSCLEEWSSLGSACAVISMLFMTTFSYTNLNQIPMQGLKNALVYPLFSGHVEGCLL